MGVSSGKKIISRRYMFPLLFLVAGFSLFVFWRLLDLPEAEALLDTLRVYFDRYGLWFLLVSAIVEGLLLLGVYYPGSIVIFLGVLLAGKDIPKVILSLVVVTLGMLIAYGINFFLGKYGWYRLLLRFGLKQPIENAQVRLTKYGLRAIFGSYWHPNFAAFIATAAGILHFSFQKFILYSITAAILWNTFWGGLTYFLGEKVLGMIGIRFALVFILLWMLFATLFPPKEEIITSQASSES